jgi:pimeloyl-ACP methyl ester carboxylesterase
MHPPLRSRAIRWSLLLALVATGSVSAQVAPYDTPPPASAPYYRVRYDGSTKPGELVYPVTYTLWVPPGVKTLRGVIVHQHGCGEGSCKSGQTAAYDLHWQALAKKHGCALLGPSYEQPEKQNCQLWCDPRNGSAKKFQEALVDLGKLAQHPELETVPWALWGHSGGGTWAGSMMLMHPERVAAAWLRSGAPKLSVTDTPGALPPLTIPDAALAVPAMCNLGTKEGVTVKEGRFAGVWKGTEAFFTAIRSKGGLIGISVDPNSSHDCGNQRYLAIPWFDACLSARLPEKAGEGSLKPMKEEGTYLTAVLSDAAQPAAQYQGDAKTAAWLPDARVARAWTEYTKDGNVSDSTPPPAPTNVKVGAEGLITWDAEADFESGIAAFIIERDGREIGRVPEKPAGSIGRPIFQKNGYSDSPTPPLAEMRYKVAAAEAGKKHSYTVRTVNSTGVPSEPSAAASP